MGEIWTGQKYGIPGGLEKLDYSYAPEEMTEPYERGERRYLKYTKISVSADEEYCAVGLEKEAGGMGGSGDITSVDYSAEEVYTKPTEIPLYAGQDVETGKSLFYIGTACLIFTALNKSYTIAGNGECPVPTSAVNDFLKNHVSKPFRPAFGTFEIDVDDIAQIGNIKYTQQQGIHNWSVEAAGVWENSSPSSSNLLEPSSEVAAVLNFPNHVKFYKHTVKMQKGKDNKATSSWSVDLYPTS